MKIQRDARRVYGAAAYGGDLWADVQGRERPAVVGRIGWARRAAIAALLVVCGGVLLVVLEGEAPVEDRQVAGVEQGDGAGAAALPSVVDALGGIDVSVVRRPRFEVPELRRSVAWGVPRRGASGLFSVPRLSKPKEIQDEHTEESDGGAGSGGGAGVESVHDGLGTRSA